MILGPDGKPSSSGIVDAHGEEIGRHGEPLTAIQVSLLGEYMPPVWVDNPEGGPRALALAYGCQAAVLHVQGKGMAPLGWRNRPPKYATVFIPEPEVPALIEKLKAMVNPE